ncbi:MAG: HcpA family protein, partial [Xanthobacteraceae bacterium]
MLALIALALAHPAMAQPKPSARVAPPVQYMPETALPAPTTGAEKPDLAFGAYQRGYFLTALQYATDDAEKGNAPAMTLLGELYANGLGVPRDDKKAADWYKLAAARGDRNAMFALAVFALQGRAGPR